MSSIRKLPTIIVVLILILITLNIEPNNVCAISKVTSKPTQKKMIILAQVKQPMLSQSGLAEWISVANAKKYQVQLYLNSSEQGTPLILSIGKTSYSFLSAMREAGPGSYTIKVTAIGDGKAYADGPQSKASSQQIIRMLPQMAQPVWIGNTINWIIDTNATNYVVKLFNKDALISSKTVSADAASLDFGNKISQSSPGIYTASVQTEGTGLYLDGAASILSNANVQSVSLDQVRKPAFSTSGATTWQNVANATNYKVQLCLNDLALGAPQAVNSGDKGCNFLPTMRATGPGSYSVKVTAIGDGLLYMNGPQSIASNTQEISKATIVTNINLNSSGIANWTAESSTSCDLKLYKDGILASAQNGVTSGYGYLAIMRDLGVGKYSVTVTTRSDAGLTLDSDESAPSNTQMITMLPRPAQPLWESNTITWNKDINASGYEVNLFKGDSLITTQTIPTGTTSFDFSNIISQNTPGDFKATVQAKGSGLLIDSGDSLLSTSNIKAVKLPKVEKPMLTTAGIAKWKNVANSASYRIQLYLNNNLLISELTENNGDKGCDFTSIIKETYAKFNRPCSFSVKVIANGDMVYLTADESDISNPLIVGAVVTSYGTAEIVLGPMTNVNTNKDYLNITKVTPIDNLLNGVETTFIVEVDYNLITVDSAILVIFANNGAEPNKGNEVSEFKVYKGSGKIRFITSIKPKMWNNTSFWILSTMHKEFDYPDITVSPAFNIKVK
jgi:hypothetical protein